MKDEADQLGFCERVDDDTYLVQRDAVQVHAHHLLNARTGDLDGFLQALKNPLGISEKFLQHNEHEGSAPRKQP